MVNKGQSAFSLPEGLCYDVNDLLNVPSQQSIGQRSGYGKISYCFTYFICESIKRQQSGHDGYGVMRIRSFYMEFRILTKSSATALEISFSECEEHRARDHYGRKNDELLSNLS
jgi:hypothetical protein